MQLNRGPTLAETIAAGSLLLARAPAEPVVEAVAEEPSSGEVWLGAAEIALLARRDPWTVAEHLRNGTLHGHVGPDGWSVRDAVVALFLAGADPASQQRVCGCRELRLVHDSRRRAPWWTSAGAQDVAFPRAVEGDRTMVIGGCRS